jgi:hypothetical protein
MPTSDIERNKDVRALRKKAKRLRALAKDTGDKHAVKKLSRQFDAKASEIARKATDRDEE